MGCLAALLIDLGLRNLSTALPTPVLRFLISRARSAGQTEKGAVVAQKDNGRKEEDINLEFRDMTRSSSREVGIRVPRFL